MFNLPLNATPGPAITNARYERVNSITDMKNVIGGTHTFRIEPSGTDWWVPARSYFRTRLKIVVGFNESKFPAWQQGGSSTTTRAVKDTKQITSWPLPVSVVESYDSTGTSKKPICKYTAETAIGYTLDETNTTAALTALSYQSVNGLRGEGFRTKNFVNVTQLPDLKYKEASAVTGIARGLNSGMDSSFGIGYFGAFKPLTCLKFLDLADCCVDAFFDQMSVSVGPQKVETVHYPQLINTMRRRQENSPAVNSSRFDSLGIFSDDQHPQQRFSNRTSAKTSVFDILGYDRIEITTSSSWEQEYTVEFDVLYVPPLSVFDLDHALPPARYEIEFKGVSSSATVQNNFFHCTLPGSTGRWYMDKQNNNQDAGVLNLKGPATLFDGKHGDGRSTITTQHTGHSIFLFEPPVAAGPDLNKHSIQNHFLGRRMCTETWLKTPKDRLDPGCFVSVQMVNMHLEAGMVTGPLTIDSQFMLEFEQTQANFITLSETHQMQNLIFDVDPYANHFYFGFRQTTVSSDPCLQEGHLVCPGNVERDLREYYISFDMKTNPPNFATEINLFNSRGATNELIRSQVNNTSLWKHAPETMRQWLKKGPYYAYDWPRDGTSNSTRFQLNLSFHDPQTKVNQGSMGPHGMFENETALSFVHTGPGFYKVSPTLDAANSNSDWASGAFDESRSNSYYLKRQLKAFNSLQEVYSFPVGSTVTNLDGKRSWNVPTLFWSLYYPASLSLLMCQSRIEACDRVEPSFRPLLSYTNLTIGDELTGHIDHKAITNAIDVLTVENQTNLSYVAQAYGSAQEIDQSFKGTEHSRPLGLSLGSNNNSCILFQIIPRKWIISTASGRVIGARTLDNRT